MTEGNTAYPTDEESLREDTDVQFFIGSGKGGQNRNKVETAVRLFHRPSKIMVVAQRQRSQAQNLQDAFARLKEKLEELNTPALERIPTKVPRSSKKKRLQTKRVRSGIKQDRRRPKIEEE